MLSGVISLGRKLLTILAKHLRPVTDLLKQGVPFDSHRESDVSLTSLARTEAIIHAQVPWLAGA